MHFGFIHFVNYMLWTYTLWTHTFWNYIFCRAPSQIINIISRKLRPFARAVDAF